MPGHRGGFVHRPRRVPGSRKRGRMDGDNTQEFFQAMTAGVEAKAAELGIEIITHDQHKPSPKGAVKGYFIQKMRLNAMPSNAYSRPLRYAVYDISLFVFLHR